MILPSLPLIFPVPESDCIMAFWLLPEARKSILALPVPTSLLNFMLSVKSGKN